LAELADLVLKIHDQWSVEYLEILQEVLETEPAEEECEVTLSELNEIARFSRDPLVLTRLGQVLESATWPDSAQADQATRLRVEALLNRMIVSEHPATVASLTRQTEQLLDTLEDGSQLTGEQVRLGNLRGYLSMLRAQKAIAQKGNVQALPLLNNAKNHYLAAALHNPQESWSRLWDIGVLLEQIGEAQQAIALYHQIANRYPHTTVGRDALLRIAQVYDQQLGAPLEALEVYARYAGRYPAELSYRQHSLGFRLRRLGYTNLLQFQKSQRLQPDGIYGPQSQRKLEELESCFDIIRVEDEDQVQVLFGKFVHPAMFKIAQRLQRSGRHYQAIKAYRMFLNLFPTKKQADDSLIAIARLFRDNRLYEEALGAYRQLLEDFRRGTTLARHTWRPPSACRTWGAGKKPKSYIVSMSRSSPSTVRCCFAREGLFCWMRFGNMKNT